MVEPQIRQGINPDWLSSTVLAIARKIYGDRAYADMPILGDSLQDGGCDDIGILAHCREPMHVRGCWVLDLILGKE